MQNQVSTKIITEQELLPILLKNHLDMGHSISVWRLPDSDVKNLLVNTEGVVLLDEVSLEDSAPGFIFSPFDNQKSKLFLKGDLIFSFKNGALLNEGNTITDPLEILQQQTKTPKNTAYYRSPDLNITSSEKIDYTKLVEKCLAGITDGLFEKIVPSRRQSFSIPSNFDPLI